MRVLISHVTGRTGRSIARSLLAAGHEVAGVAPAPLRELDPRVEFHARPVAEPRSLARVPADPPDIVLHLPDPAADGMLVGTLTMPPGTPVIVLVPDEPAAAAAVEAAWATRPGTLRVRTAPQAGRGLGAAECRTIAGLLAAPPGSRWPLVHPDDVERFLVTAVLGGLVTRSASAGVYLAAPGSVVAGTAARWLRDAGIRRVPQVVPLPVPHPGEVSEGFRAGWSAEEALADLLRGLPGRALGPGGARDLPGALTLPVEVVPARLPAGDGYPLQEASAESVRGEFDELVDPRFPVFSATNTAEALPGPLTALSLDVHAAGLRRANVMLAQLMALDGVIGDEWVSRVNAVYGHHVYLEASVSVLTAANLPGWSEESMREQAFAALPPGMPLHPLGRPTVPRGLRALRAQATVVARMAATARQFGPTASAIQRSAKAEALDAAAAAGLTDEQLHAQLRLARDRVHQAWVGAAVGIVMSGAATNIHEQVGLRGRASVSAVDLRLLESARTVAAVDRLAAVLREDPELRELAAGGEVDAAVRHSPRLAQLLDAELEQIGHRGRGECELANPVFADRPDLLLIPAARAAAVATHTQGTAEPPTGLAALTMRLVTGANVARERVRDGVVRINHRLRLLVRERAARLISAGVLDEVGDAFHLTFDELLYPPAGTRDRVARRRAERERLRTQRMPDVFSGRWEPVGETRRLSPGESIWGLGVSSGVTVGRVRILTTTEDEIEPGEVLVASVTDVGYTAMFGYAGAVVTDIGGSVSHAAIIAREFGLPCVVDTKLATARLTTGQLVRVDGSAGTVTALPGPPTVTLGEITTADGVRSPDDDQ